MIRVLEDIIRDGKLVIAASTTFENFGRYLDKYFVSVNGDRILFEGHQIIVSHRGNDDSYFIQEVPPLRIRKIYPQNEFFDLNIKGDKCLKYYSLFGMKQTQSK